ncbi:hypothetical protein AMECASPLE_025416 [Ameca splendens]|uniref:Uncharacterized protein n=1 Tax=Ameca splendens TaxID=208324 RepID=A0ABV0YS07_9TELE
MFGHTSTAFAEPRRVLQLQFSWFKPSESPNVSDPFLELFLEFLPCWKINLSFPPERSSSLPHDLLPFWIGSIGQFYSFGSDPSPGVHQLMFDNVTFHRA